MLAVVLAILAKLVIILKLGLRSISKSITSLIVLNIYTPPQHALSTINSLYFKIIEKTNSKFDLKIKEALHIEYTTKSFNSHPFTIAFVPLAPFCLCLFFSFVVFCISLLSIVFIISTLVIGIFYVLNNSLLLFQLLITHLASFEKCCCNLYSNILFHI